MEAKSEAFQVYKAMSMLKKYEIGPVFGGEMTYERVKSETDFRKVYTIPEFNISQNIQIRR